MKNILITGAGSGLGRALAIELAKSAENLFLCGRNLTNLQQTKILCADSKANIHLKIFDVKDEIASKNYIEEIEQNFTLDLVIANAGISAGTSQGTESHQQILEIFHTNIDGVINIITPAIERMKQRQRGQIAIISSLAGFIALPSSPAYSASKSAVRIYGEALRINLAPFGIKVNVICPGYIKTPMTAVNNFYMPFLMEADKASKIIIKGIKRDKNLIIFPLVFYYLIALTSLIPNFFMIKILSKLPKKTALKIDIKK